MQPVLVAAGAAVPIVIGALVVRGRARHPAGWLLIAHGVAFFALLAFPGTATTPAGRVADQLGQGLWVLLFVFLVLVAYLLPDGRFGSRFWRWWVRVGLAGVVAFVVGAAGDREGYADGHAGAAPPLPWLPAPVSGLLGVAGLVLVALLVFGSVAAVWWRLRRARDDERLQLLWLVWGALTIPVTLLTGWVDHFLLGGTRLFAAALGLVAAGLPVTIGIAVLRHRLFDIRLVLSRTLTYLPLVAAVVAVYALLLFGTDRLVGNGTAGGLLAVGVVAVAVHPAQSVLRGRIERWVYGLRADPRAALQLLAARAEAADPDGLRVAVAEAVADALRVDGVRIVDTARPGDTAPSEGTAPPGDAAPPGDGGHVVRVPMVHRGAGVGVLEVAAPLDREALDLLGDLARYAAILVRAEQLNDDLRDSRARIVAGREEERRRLRRDLHDGVGPALAAVVLKLDATQSRPDAQQRNALIAETRDEVRAAIAEVRRLVDDLRPPAIDEVGLLDALRQRAASLSGPVAFEVTGPGDVPALPAAVEVAAYRIASEAMTNVVRHAAAARCRVRIDVTGGALHLSVEDNGRGPGAAAPGVGWTSMRERAAELGGTCTVAPRPEGGTLVRAELPLAVGGTA
ncbi:sensor histidine kinase [Dactylosporangium sp. CS-033363]|uniref:sensor histidine kinase n=1 Tax=Dactylosporangium sp. CS-033363 TaxID=3239935 RepID=UPI003D8E9D6C